MIVPADAAGLRLDRFLVEALDRKASRAEIQRWIDLGAVKVDGELALPKDRVRPGSQITIERPAPPTTTLTPDAAVAFDVLHVDDALVVVMKPAGLVVHPAAGHAEGTLVHGLLARGWFKGDVDNVRPGIVHRLDKGTSGVMVVARTPAAREGLMAQFAAHSIDRAYDAITVGVTQTKTHRTLHGRHPADRKRFTTRVRRGKEAVTHVELLRPLVRASLVRCTLETGRTHQIRVHLAESGTPVLGDPLYGKTPRDALVREIADDLGHQALHARVLGFVHPSTGERVRFEIEPPADFQEALRRLEEASGSGGAKGRAR